MKETQLDGESLDIVSDNVSKLKEIFPEVITEDKIDFDKLKLILGSDIDTDSERYSFTWPGKTQAIKESQKQSTGTLRPCKEESKNWDTTKNLYIEGDNLEVLKLLQKSYFNKIKMIYIDPPYNTGNDFIYQDNYQDNLENYLELTNQIEESTNVKLTTNMETSGRFHSNWLNMMYPRLKLARNLLTNDGVILLNIDEHEIFNLQKILNEIFGEDNLLGTIIWDKRNPKGDSKGVSYQHEYIILYAKNKYEFLKNETVTRPKKNAEIILSKAKEIFNKKSPTFSLDEINKEFKNWINKNNFSGGEKAYNNIDSNGEVYRGVSMAWPNKKKAPDEYFIPLIHPITKKPCPVPERGWRNPPTTMKKLLDLDLILFGKDETTQPTRKYLLKENMFENIPSVLYYGGSDDKLLKQLNIPFDTPKATEIICEHIASFSKNNDIILDFFSGSSSTAHSVMKQNDKDGFSRRFIMVQLQEKCDENTEAFSLGFNNICEIGKERIRRAGDKILEGSGNKNLDIGFKVFKLDSSNLNKWDPDYDNLEQTLLVSQDNIKEDRTQEDLIYEIMLKYGIDLTLPIEEYDTGENKIYSIGFGALLICLDNRITKDITDSIIELASEDVSRVVFKDNGFASDADKTNIKETLRTHNIDEFITI